MSTIENSNFQFILYGDKSTKQQLTVNEPPAYRSTYVSGAQVNESGHLVLSFSDGSTVDSGYVRGGTGAQGPQGASLEWRGEWLSTATYNYLDCVTYGGNVYIYISSMASVGTPVTNTTKWEVMLRRGEAGADGTTFTPSVSADGVLSWTNNGNLTNPASVNIKGQPGRGFKVLGYFNTVSALTSSVSSPSAGDAYGVGTAQPYDIYVFDGITRSWVNNGQLQGAKGEDGADGITPTIGDNGNWFIGSTDTGKPSRGQVGQTGPAGSDAVIKVEGLLEGDGEGNVFAAETVSGSLVDIPSDDAKQNIITATGMLKCTGNGTVISASAGTDYMKPVSVTSSDNGKFMCVVNGAWAAVTVPDAEGGSY